MKQTCSKFTIGRGRPMPFGATLLAGGVNFAVFSRHATAVSLLLFHPPEKRPCAEIALDPDQHRTGDVWHVFVEGLLPGFAYGYKVEGLSSSSDPRHRYAAARTLLDPYSRSLTGPSLWCGSSREECQDGGWLGLLPDETFDWQNDRPPRHHLADLVIYEMHVRGFTRNPSSEVMHPGTFHGVTEKIPYLQELGVNAVELLPVTEFDEADNYRKNPLNGKPLHNFWGYHPLNFFAAKRAYSSDLASGGEIREFKTMVKALHAAGIEVILDMVFNHTGEGDERGRTLSFRGLDNAVYYLVDEHGVYANFSGCGNTVNCNHPVVRDLIIDSLCYWVTEMHVDGFRFDLASILGRGPSGEVLANPPLIERIAANPILADVKLIAEAWDAAGLYQVGTFPNFGRWAEWNGQFRDDLRRFVRGDPGMAPLLATRLAGSSDLYQTDGRAPFHSINFVTCHDGFTLADLVSYGSKHNEANGEFNADGCDDNFSDNHGIEGSTNDPDILAIRKRQSFNHLTLLLMAHGVPMLLAGDEMGRTQHGNNNSWCQDNQVSWINWDGLKQNPALFNLVKNLIALRKRHPMLRPRQFEGAEVDGKRLIWHGRRAGEPDWSDESRHLGMLLQDLKAEVEIYLFVNAHREAMQVDLPRLPRTRTWARFVDTALPDALVSCQPEQELRLKDQRFYQVSERSVIVLVSKS